MATEERCRTTLIDDTPAETDAFGSHERVARAIAEVVQDEEGGRSIGLEGGWGAGKSTIVTLISKILGQTKDTDCRIAVFDIWAHQGDPLRRTFLENLITRVQGFGWVNKAKWDRRIAELTKRRREETTRVVPRLSSAGRVFALTLLGIPLGATLVSAGATLLASNNVSGTWAFLPLILGMVGVLAPVIWYIWYLVTWFGHRRKITKSGGSEEDENLSEFPALVTRQASTESRTVVTQTPDPTSVEFEAVFRELLDEAFKTKGRKLLLVVDNLDRVESSDALSIWSTLQTFLGHSDYQRAGWIDRLWVLIPYDGNAILRLWDRSGSASDGDDSALAKSFLDKTFQMRFSVPPLLLTDWRRFLQGALKQAFPNHQEADFHGVYRAFAANRVLEMSAHTPRELKIFVNQVGALHRVWQDKFPLSHLACYALLQKDNEDVQSTLLSNQDPRSPKQIIGDEWRGTIAALHFGAPVEEARQLLLRGPIQVALANGDGRTLSDLESVHHNGFWSVLEDTVSAWVNDWSRIAPADLAKAATALETSQVLVNTYSQHETVAILSNIRTAAASVRAWSPFDSESANGMVAVAKLVGDSEEIVSALLAGASKARVEASEASEEEGQEGKVSPSVWMSSAFTLIEGLCEHGLAQDIGTGISVPLSAQQWLDVSREVFERDPKGRLLQYFELLAIAEIDELLAQRVVPGQIDENTFNSVRAAVATTSSNAMNSVANVVFSHLKSGVGIPAGKLVFMLKILRFSRSTGLIEEDQFAEFAAGGHYLHHLHSAVSENHSEATAECMFGFLQAVPSATEPAAVGNSHEGHQSLIELLSNPDKVPGAVDLFAALAKDTQQLSAVFAMTTGERPVPPFVARVLRTLLVSEDVSIAPELVSANWAVIREVLRESEESSESFEAFLKDLPGIDNLVAGILSENFDVLDSALYLALLRSSTRTDFMTWCKVRLSSVSQDAWSEAITSQGDLLDLVIELNTRGASVELGATYLDALVDYAEHLSDGSVSALTKESWSDLFALLDANRRELFYRRAYEKLKGSEGEASAEFFALFGDILADRSILAGDQRFIDQVCRPILTKGNASGIAWMANIANSDPALLTRHDDQPASNDFKDRIRQSLDDTPKDDPTLPHLKRIGTTLGIESLEREDAEAESDARSEDVGEASE